jgi:hypothetical protein
MSPGASSPVVGELHPRAAEAFGVKCPLEHLEGIRRRSRRPVIAVTVGGEGLELQRSIDEHNSQCNRHPMLLTSDVSMKVDPCPRPWAGGGLQFRRRRLAAARNTSAEYMSDGSLGARWDFTAG